MEIKVVDKTEIRISGSPSQASRGEVQITIGPASPPSNKVFLTTADLDARAIFKAFNSNLPAQTFRNLFDLMKQTIWPDNTQTSVPESTYTENSPEVEEMYYLADMIADQLGGPDAVDFEQTNGDTVTYSHRGKRFRFTIVEIQDNAS